MGRDLRMRPIRAFGKGVRERERLNEVFSDHATE